MISTLAYSVSTAQNQIQNSSKILGVVKCSRTLVVVVVFFSFSCVCGLFVFLLSLACSEAEALWFIKA